jgi:excisionase family DNA binding protein
VKKDDPLLNPTMTVRQAAEVLDLGLNQTYAAVERGEIPSVRFKDRIVIPTGRFKREILGE